MKDARVWVVSHVEVYLKPGTFGIDVMTTFVASSKASALRLIRATWVDPGTWWHLEAFRMDDYQVLGGAGELYSRDGRLLKRAPVEQGYRAAIPRYRKNLATLRAAVAAARREGRPRKVLDNLRRAVETTRRCLRGHPVT